MATLERAGVKLSYEDAGSGSPAMVFVHGWTCDHSHFSPQFDHFRQRHRVIGIDLRGHGASDAPEGDYSIPALADDVAWLCGQLEVASAVVVGHSMGGAVGVELAARHPELVSALVLVDAAPIGLPPELAAGLAQIVDGLAGPDPAATRRAFVAGMLFLPTDDPAVKERVLEEMLVAPDHVALGCMRGLTTWSGEAALGSVRAPVLAIHADQPINAPEKLTAICPTLTNARTPGVGHFNQLLAAAEVSRLIEEFIS